MLFDAQLLQTNFHRFSNALNVRGEIVKGNAPIPNSLISLSTAPNSVTRLHVKSGPDHKVHGPRVARKPDFVACEQQMR